MRGHIIVDMVLHQKTTGKHGILGYDVEDQQHLILFVFLFKCSWTMCNGTAI